VPDWSVEEFIFVEKEPKEAKWVSSSKGCIEEECEQQPLESQREEVGKVEKEPTREDISVPSFLPALDKIMPRHSA
jgi:hypothetical protein